MVRRSAPASRGGVAKKSRLFPMRNTRHYWIESTSAFVEAFRKSFSLTPKARNDLTGETEPKRSLAAVLRSATSVRLIAFREGSISESGSDKRDCGQHGRVVEKSAT